MNNKNIALISLVFMAILPAAAGAAGLDVVDSLQSQFKSTTTALGLSMQSMATWLLFSLTTISYTWRAGLMLLRGTDIQGFFAEFVSLVMVTGLWYWVIQSSPDFAQTIVQGWIWIGNHATGASQSISVSEVALRGIDLASKIFDSSDIVTAVPFFFAGCFVAILYAVIAAFALGVIVEMYITTSAGVILLGFGAAEWTSDYARKYLVYCMAVGIKLFVMYFILGVGDRFINDWVSSMNYGEMNSIFTLLTTLVIVALLVFKIPNVAQGLVSGVSLANVGGALGATGQIMGAAAGAVGGAVAGAAGGLMAVKEAAALGATQPGSSSGKQYQAMNTLNNLANSAGAIVGNRMMGDYNASSGSFGGSMAQQMRQQRLGGSGLYGGAAADSSHVGGSPSGGSGGGGSIGKDGDPERAAANGADSSKQSVAEYAEKARYKSPAVDLTRERG